MKDTCVVLGGKDREMDEISKVAKETKLAMFDNNLNWGAKLSHYKQELNEINKFETVILVELELDIISEIKGKKIIIDHHGETAGNPPAIIQFLNFLNIEPSREQILIGAMDAAWVPGLISMSATHYEIAHLLNVNPDDIESMLIEAADRSLTRIEIDQAELAVMNSVPSDSLIIVKCEHSKCSSITARLWAAQTTQNVLVVSPKELNYYGTGGKVRKIIEAVKEGWVGGAGLTNPTEEALEFWNIGGGIPDTAFWGSYDVSLESKIIDLVKL